MRAAFTRTLVELAERDPRIVLLTGDLGFMALEPFSERFPKRFFNVGVAEQNMVGLATGLAEAGFIPFVYSIVTFATLRPYEFIRNGPILHQFPVRIVGVGGGYEYGTAGPTHHGLEDIGVLRIQPGITVIAPADTEQIVTAMQATWDLPGPVYYRIGKDDKLIVPGLNGRFELGRAQVIGHGSDVLFVTMGSITSEVVKAAEVLYAQGVSCTILIVASMNPAPEADIAEVVSKFKIAFTVEAHYAVGGIGSLVSEIVAQNGLNCRIVRCAVKETPNGKSGSQAFFQEMQGISSSALVKNVLRELSLVGNE
jgi:transketolase